MFTPNLVYHSYAVTETSKEVAVRNINNLSGSCKHALNLNSPKLQITKVIQKNKKMARNFTTERKEDELSEREKVALTMSL